MSIFNILDYGAKVSDLLQTAYIQAAIDDCFRAGGGEVVIPAGFFRTGGLTLRSGVTLHLLSGAVLEGSRDPEDYAAWKNDAVEPMTAAQIEEMEQSAESRSANPWSRWNHGLIRARGAHDIAVIGDPGSCIDGQNCFDASGEEGYRGPHGINLWDCHRVTLRGYTIRNTGNWAHAIFRSQNVHIDDLTILAGHDGVDVFLCDGVLAENCRILTGDDCIAGFGSIHVTVRDCELNSSCSCIRFGGTYVLFERCHAAAPGAFAHRCTLSAEERAASLMTTEKHRRNTLNVFLYYCDDRFGKLPYKPGSIVLRDCRFDGADRLFSMAFALHRWCNNAPLESITFEHSVFTGLKLASFIHGDPDTPFRFTLRDVVLTPDCGADPSVFIDAEYFDEILLDNVDVSAYTNPAVICRSAGQVTVSGSTPAIAVRSGESGMSGVKGQ